jgi:hypothetical protein
MIPSGFSLADVSFDSEDPWDVSQIKDKQVLIFRVPWDFPTVQLSGKSLGESIKIKTDNQRLNFTVQELDDDVGELSNVNIISSDASSKSFKNGILYL